MGTNRRPSPAEPIAVPEPAGAPIAAVAEPAAGPLCSRCTEPLDTTGSPTWCKSCRANYQREYKALRAEMTESRGYAAGVSAMRAYLAAQFAKLGSGGFTASEVAALIRQSQGPDADSRSTPAA